MNPAALFGGDTEADAPVEDPLDLLDLWLSRVDATEMAADPTATTAVATDSTTTPLMALATVDADGFPRVRHVLLSSYDRGRLHFHTDTRTSKSAQLFADPRAGATIVWPDIPRQLSVAGTVAFETPAEQAAGYARRTRYLQLLAWVNDDELARRPKAERASAFAEFDAEQPELGPPSTWVGYVLVPEIITFWRGGPGGPSQRISCRRTAEGWTVDRLAG